jgi:transposase
MIRRVLNGIFHILRTGAPWRDMPERYGPYTHLLQSLQPMGQGQGVAGHFRGSGATPQSLHLIDSSIVRAHQHAAGGKKGARITRSAVLVAD